MDHVSVNNNNNTKVSISNTNAFINLKYCKEALEGMEKAFTVLSDEKDEENNTETGACPKWKPFIVTSPTNDSTTNNCKDWNPNALIQAMQQYYNRHFSSTITNSTSASVVSSYLMTTPLTSDPSLRSMTDETSGTDQNSGIHQRNNKGGRVTFGSKTTNRRRNKRKLMDLTTPVQPKDNHYENEFTFESQSPLDDYHRIDLSKNNDNKNEDCKDAEKKMTKTTSHNVTISKKKLKKEYGKRKTSLLHTNSYFFDSPVAPINSNDTNKPNSPLVSVFQSSSSQDTSDDNNYKSITHNRKRNYSSKNLEKKFHQIQIEDTHVEKKNIDHHISPDQCNSDDNNNVEDSESNSIDIIGIKKIENHEVVDTKGIDTTERNENNEKSKNTIRVKDEKEDINATRGNIQVDFLMESTSSNHVKKNDDVMKVVKINRIDDKNDKNYDKSNENDDDDQIYVPRQLDFMFQQTISSSSPPTTTNNTSRSAMETKMSNETDLKSTRHDKTTTVEVPKTTNSLLILSNDLSCRNLSFSQQSLQSEHPPLDFWKLQSTSSGNGYENYDLQPPSPDETETYCPTPPTSDDEQDDNDKDNLSQTSSKPPSSKNHQQRTQQSFQMELQHSDSYPRNREPLLSSSSSSQALSPTMLSQEKNENKKSIVPSPSVQESSIKEQIESNDHNKDGDREEVQLFPQKSDENLDTGNDDDTEEVLPSPQNPQKVNVNSDVEEPAKQFQNDSNDMDVDKEDDDDLEDESPPINSFLEAHFRYLEEGGTQVSQSQMNKNNHDIDVEDDEEEEEGTPQPKNRTLSSMEAESIVSRKNNLSTPTAKKVGGLQLLLDDELDSPPEPANETDMMEDATDHVYDRDHSYERAPCRSSAEDNEIVQETCPILMVPETCPPPMPPSQLQGPSLYPRNRKPLLFSSLDEDNKTNINNGTRHVEKLSQGIKSKSASISNHNYSKTDSKIKSNENSQDTIESHRLNDREKEQEQREAEDVIENSEEKIEAIDMKSESSSPVLLSPKDKMDDLNGSKLEKYNIPTQRGITIEKKKIDISSPVVEKAISSPFGTTGSSGSSTTTFIPSPLRKRSVKTIVFDVLKPNEADALQNLLPLSFLLNNDKKDVNECYYEVKSEIPLDKPNSVKNTIFVTSINNKNVLSSFEYLKARILGVMVVESRWLTHSFENNRTWLPPTNFRVKRKLMRKRDNRPPSQPQWFQNCECLVLQKEIDTIDATLSSWSTSTAGDASKQAIYNPPTGLTTCQMNLLIELLGGRIVSSFESFTNIHHSSLSQNRSNNDNPSNKYRMILLPPSSGKISETSMKQQLFNNPFQMKHVKLVPSKDIRLPRNDSHPDNRMPGYEGGSIIPIVYWHWLVDCISHQNLIPPLSKHIYANVSL